MAIELLLIAVIGTILTSFSKKINIPSELFLVVIMGIVSFLPFLPDIKINGGVLLEILLPPLLFSAARNLSSYKFRKVRNPVIWLGVGLIFLTAFSVAFVAHSITGYMTITAGLILGAVVAPPDAVSSVSIGKKIGLPDKVLSILTGESLINDAAALTLFSIGIAFLYERDIFIKEPILLLLWTAFIGILVGFILGVITVIIRRILNEANIIAIFTLLMPFLIYWCAEHIHSSGVLAVVTAGFIIEKSSIHIRHNIKIQEKSVWKAVETLLDAFVFSYIGLQIKSIIIDLHLSNLDTFQTLGQGLIILLVVLLIRPIAVLMYNGLRLLYYRFEYKHLAHFVTSKKRILSTRENLATAGVSWREYIILSWTGMRGVVTLATASSVPIIIYGSENLYESDSFKTHLFIQVAGLIVAIGTLLIQGLSLPFIIRKLLPNTSSNTRLNAKNSSIQEGQWGIARQITNDTAIRVIEDEYDADPNFDREHILNVWRTLDTVSISKSKQDISFVSQLFIQIAASQKEAIQNAVIKGVIHPDIGREFINNLDMRLSIFEENN